MISFCYFSISFAVKNIITIAIKNAKTNTTKKLCSVAALISIAIKTIHKRISIAAIVIIILLYFFLFIIPITLNQFPTMQLLFIFICIIVVVHLFFLDNMTNVSLFLSLFLFLHYAILVCVKLLIIWPIACSSGNK